VLERRAAILSWFLAVKYVIGARLGGTYENVVPASDLILEWFDEPLEHGRDIMVVHRGTSVIASLTFR
jgi:hypothetical protein